MPYRQLGKSPLKVSTLCLGTMMFGDQTALNEAASIVADAREHGVNYIDTSDNYSKGGSETMVGQLLKGQRQDWVLANPGHPSTPGYTDPNYPPTGRFRTV
jgi:aryl-alcohol dehydrogenase-like predicted oxidoreductase